ncbi:ankyrin repeat protein [Hydrogenophaga palleronii]|uniref:Ankyrin repeat protein n=1 Tax=Hydrogenophaga palleronii TaxID=65655 RepID=A0ABU1WRS9_9BURK|nr:hypothetical protein [Hydrogenophaga palleronii]MDR7151978.1 ankyrin repeat protein [Hydrogenophaga palleronii]
MSADEKPTLFRPAIGNGGMTPLHFSTYCGDMNELCRSLDAGADPNARDSYRGYTAVHWLADMAATGGPRVQMLRRLAEAGADFNLKANAGETALGLALEAGTAGSEQLAEELKMLGVEE